MPGPYSGIGGWFSMALLHRARGALQRRAWLIFKVHALLLDCEGPVLDLRVDGADVLAEDARKSS